jgi:hypothetical protein
MSDRRQRPMSRREWIGSLSSAGLVVSTASLLDSAPHGNVELMAGILVAALCLCVVGGFILRSFFGKRTPQSVVSRQEVVNEY